MSATCDERRTERVARLVFLHGFTQTHHHWHLAAHLVAERLDADPVIVVPDLPGHGLSADDRSDIETAAGELARSNGPATYVGYSMGGRIALHVAVAASSPIERLVLIGATPGIVDDDERAERRRADEARADRIESIGVEAFLDEWLANPLFATLPADPDGLTHRRRNTAGGLAHSLRTSGTGAQRSLWDDLDRVTIPVLVLAGELDTKFTAIGHAMVDRLPNATFVAIDGAGHAAHSERPTEVADVIAGWLNG
jgi:2-succinyl-6-hydroxy-2,4-cyclohexadiene-1-carboxylate synthase